MANRSDKLKRRLSILTTLGIVIAILAVGAIAVALHT